jgi:hypothetical protein
MKLYYQHKITGQVILSLNNLRDLIDENGKFSGCITDIIIPDYKLGYGIISTVIHYKTIRNNYKRINKNVAHSIHPDFVQWRHVNDRENKSVTILGKSYLNDLIPIRKDGYGIDLRK